MHPKIPTATQNWPPACKVVLFTAINRCAELCARSERLSYLRWA